MNYLSALSLFKTHVSITTKSSVGSLQATVCASTIISDHNSLSGLYKCVFASVHNDRQLFHLVG